MLSGEIDTLLKGEELSAAIDVGTLGAGNLFSKAVEKIGGWGKTLLLGSIPFLMGAGVPKVKGKPGAGSALEGSASVVWETRLQMMRAGLGELLPSLVKGQGYRGRAGIDNLVSALEREGITAADFQVHHLIPGNVAQDFKVMQYAANDKNLGYSINNPGNLLVLPKDKRAAELLGLPWHSGSHGNYDGLIRGKMENLQSWYNENIGKMFKNEFDAQLARKLGELQRFGALNILHGPAVRLK
jgi:hypothetical protein